MAKSIKVTRFIYRLHRCPAAGYVFTVYAANSKNNVDFEYREERSPAALRKWIQKEYPNLCKVPSVKEIKALDHEGVCTIAEIPKKEHFYLSLPLRAS